MDIENLDFIKKVNDWLNEQDEVFIIIRDDRYGNHQYAVAKSYPQFFEIINTLPERTDMFVFKEQQLPLRGISNDSFLEQALMELDTPKDFLILSIEDENYQMNDSFHGDMNWELKAKFDDFLGQQVAFGEMPPWYDFQNNDFTSDKVQHWTIPLREINILLQENEPSLDAIEGEYPKNLGNRTKLGGVPEWIQFDETPTCPTCEKKMVFVTQVDSIDYTARPISQQSYMFGDVGMIYVFFCFECTETASIFQCY